MPKNILPHGLHKTCWLLLLTVLLFLITLSAPYWVPHDPYLQNLDLALQAPSAEYPFGTDRYGRCVFSRVLVGGQSSIFSALALVGIIFTTGTAAGLWSGYYGGKLDNFIMRLSDIFLAFPGLVFAIAVASILGGEFDPAARSRLAVQISQQLLDDNAFIYASHLKMSFVMKSNIKGFTAHPSDYYEITSDLEV